MGTWRSKPEKSSRPGGFRARLLVAFMIPVVLLGSLFVLLTEHLLAGASDFAALPTTAVRLIVMGGIFLSLLLSIGLALHTGDRFTRPVGWLLRAINAGQVRMLSQLPPPAADWELGVLCERVRVLIRQNLSGATAMEELESLRSEVTAVLDAVERGELPPDRWPAEGATHPLTRRLLDFFRTRGERVRASNESVNRLRGLLEQDWREETLAVDEIVRRAERSYLMQTEIGIELERLERMLNGAGQRRLAWDELLSLLEDLRLGIECWRAEVSALLGSQGRSDRRVGWERWIEESHAMLSDHVSKVVAGRAATVDQVASTLSQLGTALSGSGQEAGAVSREAVQLRHAWGRLGERLRTLTVRVGELQDGVCGTRSSPWEDSKVDASE